MIGKSNTLHTVCGGCVLQSTLLHHQQRQHITPTTTTCLLMPLKLTTETGPNDDNVIWATGNYFFKCFLLFYLIFPYIIIGFIYGITTPLPPNHDGDQHGHYPTSQNHHHEQLLVGWEWIQPQKAEGTATPPTTNGDEPNKKKGPRDVDDVSWATGKFFCCVPSFFFVPFFFVCSFLFLLTKFFRY